ncbi:flagellar associated protein [Raphidocelis subcapitata]|uniref:Cilia- and flagella-associated protein 52 n=1 Tax=Raphidocelis subcapitata TaxID=307507 RepID=A0A2V0NV95_9CHLO|nr:flagellar associated protein [Raphidocelis subcapitata]|eukprot:GBF88745.1 flagellar associated protein [Raphidocelis subcapitata]
MADARLELISVVGLSAAEDTLLLHPDGRTLIYPLGSTIVLRDKEDGKAQEFLQGHSDRVSALALLRSGNLLASGQFTYLGFPADIIIWDLPSRSLLHRLQLQKVKIQALSFSPDEATLASLGGADDNSLVLWDVASGAPICGAPTNSDFVLRCSFLNHDSSRIVTAGNYNLRVWTYDSANNKLVPQDAQLGQLQRMVRSLTVDADDAFVYAGTTSGDVLQVGLDRVLLRNTGPLKAPLQLGVTASAAAPGRGMLLIGSGDGAVALLSTAAEAGGNSGGGGGGGGGGGRGATGAATGRGSPQKPRPMGIIAAARVEGGVSSIVVEGSTAPAKGRGAAAGAGAGGGGFTALVATKASNLYRVTYDAAARTLTEELIQSAHPERINGVAFPIGYSEVFATASPGAVRVWHLDSCRELLRIAVANLECKCLAFAVDGRAIISGWSDGKVRAFGPQSGKLLYTINDAHHKAVTALAVTPNDAGRLISGGEEGMVRIWRVGRGGAVMEASLKDHKGPVNAVAVKNAGGDEAVSASSDGSCIVWDLTTHRRRASLYGNTFFTCVAYHPDDSQIVTCGTDRKITYWDAYDCQAIRVVEGSASATVGALVTSPDGEALLSGGADRLVKLWGYDDGLCHAAGAGHSGAVTGLQVSPDGGRVVSVGAEGGIFVWNYRRPPPLGEAGGA